MNESTNTTKTNLYKADQYDQFAEDMHQRFPLMFQNSYGGFCTGPGWWHIIEVLCLNIQRYIEGRQKTRAILLANNPYNITIPDEVPQVVVEQIKEKFGGLRFYYSGGDDTIDGMVRIAEAWASRTCETCGHPGELRYGGWVRTLCDYHEEEYQKHGRNATGWIGPNTL